MTFTVKCTYFTHILVYGLITWISETNIIDITSKQNISFNFLSYRTLTCLTRILKALDILKVIGHIHTNLDTLVGI